jgi:NADPH:quinone reductase-like Zn-dependent oxidoreductase
MPGSGLTLKVSPDNKIKQTPSLRSGMDDWQRYGVTQGDKMKAIVCTKYGSPDVLQFKDVEKPTPADDEVLIRVHAASVNQYDWHLLTADFFLVRLMGGGLLKPKNSRPGADVAGRVEAVGRHVQQLKPGDEVFGDLAASGNGAFAEYVSVPEHAVALKPANLTFEQAAAVPMAAVTALMNFDSQNR